MPPNQQYPGGPQPSPQPQQTPNGSYEVLPPLPAGQNNGHSGHNPYEFIVNPQTKQKKSPLFGGNKFAAQVAVLVGGAVVLMIIVAIVVNLLAPKSPIEDMTAVVQRQQEIIRIASAASNNVTGQDTKNFMTNVSNTVASDQQQAITYLADHNKKLKPKVLAMDQSADTDTQLDNAAAANTYDTVSVQVMTNQLGTYQRLLAQTFKHTENTDLKKQLQHASTSNGMLLEQAKAIGK